MISEIDISKKVYSESIIRRYREHGDSVLFCTMPYNRKPYIIDILHKFEFREGIHNLRTVSYHWINRSGRLFDTCVRSAYYYKRILRYHGELRGLLNAGQRVS